MAGINALQRQQDWGTQYLDDSGQWLQSEDAGTLAADPSGADENGARFATGASDPPPPNLVSTVISALTDVPAATTAGSPAPSAPTETVMTPNIETAQSVDGAADAPPADPLAAAPSTDPAASIGATAQADAAADQATPAALAPGDHTAAEWAEIGAAWQASPNDFATLYQAMAQHGWTDADIAHVSGLSEQQVGDDLTRAGAQAGFGGAATIGREAIQLAFFTALQAEQGNPPAQADASRPWWVITPGVTTQQVTYGGSGMQLTTSTSAPTISFNLQAFTTWYESQATPAAQEFASVLGGFTVDAAGALNFAGGATLSANGKGLGWATPALIPTPVAAPAPAPVATPDPTASAPADPTIPDAPLIDGRTADEWAQISAVWQAAPGNFFELYQQMEERGWTAADIAHVSGMTEQQVGDYLTSGGAPAGFGGAVTLGRDAVDNPYLAALANEEANPPSAPDASRPWWSIATPPPGATLNASGQLVDESGNVQPTTSFNLAVFTNWYESQPTTDAQNFARLHGGMTAGTAGSVHFASGASVSLSYSGSGAPGAANLQWPMDKRITQYESYPQLDELQRAYMQGMLDQPQLQQLLQVFGSSLPAALPNNELGDRARRMYGSDLALEMYRLQSATDALKQRYVSDLNAELSNPPSQNDPSRPWWGVTPPGPPQTSIRYDGNGMHQETTSTPAMVNFDLAGYQQWYASQADPVHQLFSQIYGSGVSGSADPTGRDQATEMNSDYRTIPTGPIASWYHTSGALDGLYITLTNDGSGRHASVFEDTPWTKNLTTVDLGNPQDLNDSSQVSYLPVVGFVTSMDNLSSDTPFLDAALPIVFVAAFAILTGGAAAGLGAVGAAAVVGGVTSAVSGVINDNFSLKSVLIGALSGALTAGLMDEAKALTSGLTSTMSSTAVAATQVVEQATVQGAVQALMGGKFADGALAGFASGLSQALSTQLNASINANTSMSPTEAMAARGFCSMFTTAVKMMGSGTSGAGQDLAQAFLGGVLQEAGSPSSTLDPTTIGTTGQDLTPVVVGGPGATTMPGVVPTPPPPPPPVVDPPPPPPPPVVDPPSPPPPPVDPPPPPPPVAPAPPPTLDPTTIGTMGQVTAPAPAPAPAVTTPVATPTSGQSPVTSTPSGSTPAASTDGNASTSTSIDAGATDPNAQADFRANEIAVQNAAALKQDLYEQLAEAFAKQGDTPVDRSGDVQTAGPGGAPVSNTARVELSGGYWARDFDLPDGTHVLKTMDDPTNSVRMIADLPMDSSPPDVPGYTAVETRSTAALGTKDVYYLPTPNDVAGLTKLDSLAASQGSATGSAASNSGSAVTSAVGSSQANGATAIPLITLVGTTSLIDGVTTFVTNIGKLVVAFAGEAVGAVGAGIALLVIPSSLGSPAQVVKLNDTQRFVLDPNSETHGHVEELSPGGQWLTDPKMTNVQLGMQNGQYIALTDDQLRQYYQPTTTPATPPQPPTGTPPLTLPNGGHDTSTPGLIATPPNGSTTITTPSHTPTADDLIIQNKNADDNAKLAADRYKNNPSLADPATLAGKTELGIGTWAYPTTPRTANGAGYQEQQTGVPAGLELNVGGKIGESINGTPMATGGANFDGIRRDGNQTVLIDAKDWGGYVLPDKSFWTEDSVLTPARSQVKAISQLGDNVTIEWLASTQKAADAIEEVLAEDPDLKAKIKVEYKP